MRLVPLNQTQGSQEGLEMVTLGRYGCKVSWLMRNRLRTAWLWSLFWITEYQLYTLQETNKSWFFLQLHFGLFNFQWIWALYLLKVHILMLVSLWLTRRSHSEVKNDQHGKVTWLCGKEFAYWYMVFAPVLEQVLPYQVRFDSDGYIESQKVIVGLCYLHLVNHINQMEGWCENKVCARVLLAYEACFKLYAGTPVRTRLMKWRRDALHIASGILWCFWNLFLREHDLILVGYVGSEELMLKYSRGSLNLHYLARESNTNIVIYENTKLEL